MGFVSLKLEGFEPPMLDTSSSVGPGHLEESARTMEVTIFQVLRALPYPASEEVSGAGETMPVP